MDRLMVSSYPKINLALDILGKDSSGYHHIRTVFHELSGPSAKLRDEIILERRDDGLIEISSDNKNMPIDYTNSVRKAATMLQEFLKEKSFAEFPGVSIFIKKRIPLAGGLGGGSSNAVASLKAIAQLWKVPCCGGDHKRTECLLQKIAEKIGMDCPFFFFGDTALGEHFGEKITPLPSLPSAIHCEIIETGVEISSRHAYENLLFERCGKNTEKTQKLITALRAGDAAGIMENLHNEFEESVFAAYPELLKKKADAGHNGRVMLCGSGGTLARLWLTA